MKIPQKFYEFCRSKEGATAVEYALVIATLSLIVISAAAVVGGQTAETWNTVGNAMNQTN